LDSGAAPNNGYNSNGAATVSAILKAYAASLTAERVTIGDLVHVMRDRAFGALMIVLALPNVLPVALPGLSAILGTPLIFIAAQLMFGRTEPWLPHFVAKRGLPRDGFVRLVNRMMPHLERAEAYLKPRWPLLTSRTGEMAIGAVCFGFAFIIALPVPLGNVVPGIAVSLLSLGLVAKDGVAVIVGLCMGVVASAVVAAAMAGIIVISFNILDKVF
jgi:hypothetical protein